MNLINSNAATHVPGVMAAPDLRAGLGPNEAAVDASEITIAELVGKVYEAAPANLRGRLLEQLMRPLSMLSLVAVAGGAFASLCLRDGWQDLRIRIEDTQNVRAVDVAALVDYVQQVSIEAVDGLAQTLGASPWIAGSAAAALLVRLLVQRARTRRARDGVAVSASDAGH